MTKGTTTPKESDTRTTNEHFRVCIDQSKKRRNEREQYALKAKGTYTGYSHPSKIFPSPSPC
jgi:hypothetical protein